MLFDTSLRRDLARSFGATLVVVLTIVVTMLLVRTLSLAAGDVIEPNDVLLVLGYTALAHLPTMMSLSMFASIVVAFARMYRDSEMAIWFASGLPLARFVRPVLRTFWPVLAMVAALLVFAWPWVNRSSLEIRDRYTQRADLARVTPGVFQSSTDGRRVFFVERDAADEMQARNVFVLSNAKDVESVISAHSGRIDMADDDRFLVLENGQRSDVDQRSGELSLARFDTYRVLVKPGKLRQAQAMPPKTLPTIDLLRQPGAANQAELVWRFGLFAAAVNLALLGVGLSHVNTRRPNSWNLIFALLGSVVYLNLINLSQTWVAGSRIGALQAFAGLHGAAFVLALSLLWWRDHAAVFRLRWHRASGVGP